MESRAYQVREMPFYLRFLDAIPLTHHRRRVQLVSCIEHRRLLL